MRKFLHVLGALLCCSFTVAQTIDHAYNDKIKAYTTDPRFLPLSVLDLPVDPRIPSPLKYFGEIIGAPGIMHRTTEIYQYYAALAAASPLLKVVQVGVSEEGRPIHLVIIGNEESMLRLDHYKAQLALLADPRKVNDNAAAIIKDSKPVFYLNGGLHSPEMGSPEMLMELAYRLVASQSDEIKNVREKVIVLINPVSEPDGRDKQVDWYYRYTKARTEFDDGFPRSSPYWGKYVYHDNNRDGLQVSQALTKAIFRIFYEWHPTTMLDLHESVPLLYISTGTGPYNEQVDPIAVGEWQVMANHDITTLASQGLPGAFDWAFYDGWWPGYGIWVANNHNSIGRFYETFGNAGANTYLRDLSDQKYAGDSATSREWYRPDPPTRWVKWSSRNNTNYMQAGVLASLSYVATNDKLLLRNFYQKGLNSVRKGREEKPRSFTIPKQQRDPAMVVYLVNQLRTQAIEVSENDNNYVVMLDQPYRNLALSLLTKQNYPKEAKFPPYDDIAWTLGYLYGVEVTADDTVRYDKSSLRMVTTDAHYAGSVSGEGSIFYIPYKAQNTVLPALYWLREQQKAAELTVLDTAHVIGKDTVSAGTLIVKKVSGDLVRKFSSQFGLDVKAASTIEYAGKHHKVTLPRVAIYHTWHSTQDAGWSRYTFDQRGIPYASINKDHLKAGGLRAKYDVILVPRAHGSASDFIHEIDTRFGPMPYTRTSAFPSHGLPDATHDMTGGPGFEGIAQLKKFVDEGGVLITIDNSTNLASGTGIARQLDPYTPQGLFHPGSVVQVKARKSRSPILYGYPETFHVFRGMGPLYQVEKYDRDMIILQYGTKPLKDEEEYKGPVLGMPERQVTAPRKTGKANDADKTGKEEKKPGPYVLSGMVRNEQTIIGHGTIFNVPVGKGRVVAFTFDPLHRYLNHHDAPLVWNTLINWTGWILNNRK